MVTQCAGYSLNSPSQCNNPNAFLLIDLYGIGAFLTHIVFIRMLQYYIHKGEIRLNMIVLFSEHVVSYSYTIK